MKTLVAITVAIATLLHLPASFAQIKFETTPVVVHNEDLTVLGMTVVTLLILSIGSYTSDESRGSQNSQLEFAKQKAEALRDDASSFLAQSGNAEKPSDFLRTFLNEVRVRLPVESEVTDREIAAKAFELTSTILLSQ